MESNKFFFSWLKYRSISRLHLFYWRPAAAPTAPSTSELEETLQRRGARHQNHPFFPFFFGGFKWWSSTKIPKKPDKHALWTYDIHPFRCVFWWIFCSPSLGPKCETLGQHIGKSLKEVSVELLDQWINRCLFFLVAFLSKRGVGEAVGEPPQKAPPDPTKWFSEKHQYTSSGHVGFWVHVRFVEVFCFGGDIYIYVFFPKDSVS